MRVNRNQINQPAFRHCLNMRDKVLHQKMIESSSSTCVCVAYVFPVGFPSPLMRCFQCKLQAYPNVKTVSTSYVDKIITLQLKKFNSLKTKHEQSCLNAEKYNIPKICIFNSLHPSSKIKPPSPGID